MDKERITGGVKKATGSIKKTAGKLTGDRRLEAEGRAEKTEGRVRSAVWPKPRTRYASSSNGSKN